MSNDQHAKFELQISSSKELVRRIDQRIDLVGRLLAEADAEQALALPSSFTNSLGMKMMWCPPGKFVMGSPRMKKAGPTMKIKFRCGSARASGWPAHW
jgi:formylglycine-generating enzyme required for sulfatase activity